MSTMTPIFEDQDGSAPSSPHARDNTVQHPTLNRAFRSTRSLDRGLPAHPAPQPHRHDLRRARLGVLGFDKQQAVAANWSFRQGLSTALRRRPARSPPAGARVSGLPGPDRSRTGTLSCRSLPAASSGCSSRWIRYGPRLSPLPSTPLYSTAVPLPCPPPAQRCTSTNASRIAVPPSSAPAAPIFHPLSGTARRRTLTSAPRFSAGQRGGSRPSASRPGPPAGPTRQRASRSAPTPRTGLGDRPEVLLSAAPCDAVAGLHKLVSESVMRRIDSSPS